MKVTVDRGACIGCGLCAEICPEVFEMDEDNIATIISQPDASTMASAKEAAGSCPVSAITIE
ncbi:ferredoxin [Ruminococcaceae bacterium OttesenSCG-928-A16]|nr:ferredoxin [Ruminococcaceae bacterium OttesenSCG-928-A16]